MKILTRGLLAILLVATPLTVAINLASANTEMVPSSRLVAPFVSATSTRPTFLLLINTSTDDLRGADAPTTTVGSVHVTFYNKVCNETDKAVHLSAKDIDQINVVAADLAPETIGFADIDVRSGASPTFGDAATSTSVQSNSLLGHVIITDTVSDFALSYPMAASLGSAAAGHASSGLLTAGPIVTRNATTGRAASWTGRYEPFSTRLFVPGYYAEGGGTAAGAITESLLAIASPADGFWYGGTNDEGEAPGQDLSLSTLTGANLVDMPLINIFDGCEKGISRELTGHYIAVSLAGTAPDGFGTALNRDSDKGNWTTGKCAVSFGGLDEVAGTPVGWIDLPNASCARAANNNFAAINTCSTGGGAGASSGTVAKKRGVVGVLFEVTVVSSSSTRGADVARLWGDPSSITGQSGCLDSVGGSSTPACQYSLANSVTFP